MESVGGVDRANRIGILPSEVILQYSGLEVLKRMVNGELPHPAMSEIIPFRLTEALLGKWFLRVRPTKDFTIRPAMFTAGMQ